MLLLLQAAPGGGNTLLGLPLILVQLAGFALVFYFLILRPQGTARKKHQEVLGTMKKGDEVMTAGGIIGRVKDIREMEFGSVKETRVTIETGSSTVVVERSRIVRVGSSVSVAANAQGAAQG
ncbi:MAG: preprotein translocase subunit YajC [Gemmatimonadales bacterium]|nr:preprotein translocase subunit YajC [Gemmatimonadales bacterium]